MAREVGWKRHGAAKSMFVFSEGSRLRSWGFSGEIWRTFWMILISFEEPVGIKVDLEVKGAIWAGLGVSWKSFWVVLGSC